MNKKRGLPKGFLLCLCALLVLCAPACALKLRPGRLGGSASQQKQSGSSRYNKDAIRLDQELTCYNTNLGIAFTVPKGWWLLDLNTANFSPEPDDTVDAGEFDIIYGENSRRMDLISFANLRSPDRKNYLGFEMSAESRGNSRENGDFPENFTLNPSSSGENHSTDTLAINLKTGYILSITVRYWPENQNAETAANELIKNALLVDQNP